MRKSTCLLALSPPPAGSAKAHSAKAKAMRTTVGDFQAHVHDGAGMGGSARHWGHRVLRGGELEFRGLGRLG
eukprot:8363890-Alexandrium_andersonii.AAC.1